MDTGTITSLVRTDRATKAGKSYFDITIDDNPITFQTTFENLSEGQTINYEVDNGFLKVITDGKPYQKKSYSKGEPIEHKLVGFAMSYAKDLVIAGKIDISEMSAYSDKILKHMKGQINGTNS